MPFGLLAEYRPSVDKRLIVVAGSIPSAKASAGIEINAQKSLVTIAEERKKRMPQYAEHTKVPVEKSRLDIEKILRKYGATSFISGYEDNDEADTETAMVGFRIGDLRVRFLLSMPSLTSEEFTRTAKRRPRSKAQAVKSWEFACRQRWRALRLVIQAKLEAVEAQISTVENEFLANVVFPDGTTVGERIIPQLQEAIAGAGMPKLLPEKTL